MDATAIATAATGESCVVIAAAIAAGGPAHRMARAQAAAVSDIAPVLTSDLFLDERDNLIQVIICTIMVQFANKVGSSYFCVA